MAFLQKEFSNGVTCKRSKRISDEREKIFISVTRNISKLIGNFKEYDNVKEKLICFIDVYELINKNFEILNQNFYKTKIFLFSVYEKKKEVIIQVKDKIDKGEKIQLLYNKFLKVTSIFERKFFDNVFENMKKKSSTVNDCPICLENIEKKEIVVTDCNHCFHKKCLFESLIEINRCPICRSTI